MKIGYVLAAAGLAAVGAITATSIVSAEDSIGSKMGATATLDAKSGKLTLVLKGKEAGVYVNTDFPLKCTLSVADGGTLEKKELTKDDAKLEDSGKAGKAKSATFSVKADKKVTGECKMVACTDTGCSSPFKLPFASN